MNHVHKHFDSMQQFASFNNENPRQPYADKFSETAPNHWTGGVDYNEAMETVLLDGCRWEQGRVEIEKAYIKANDTKLRKQSIKRTTRSYAGSRPHVPAYLAGSQKAMIKTATKPVFKQVVKILAPMSFQSDVTQQQIYNFGAAVLAVIKELESQNKRVELTGVLNPKRTHDHMTVTVRLKNSDDNIGIYDLAYPLCHSSCYRRIGFGITERLMDWTKCEDYGATWTVSHDIVNDYDVVLNVVTALQVYNDAARTLEYVTRQVNQQLNKGE